MFATDLVATDLVATDLVATDLAATFHPSLSANRSRFLWLTLPCAS